MEDAKACIQAMEIARYPPLFCVIGIYIDRHIERGIVVHLETLLLR